MRNLRDIFVLGDSNSPSADLEIAMESAMDGNPGSMHNHIVELFYNEFSKIGNDSDAHTAFRFTSIPKIKRVSSLEDNPVIKDILNGSLTFSNPANFNDPMDPILREWLNIQKKEANDKKSQSLFGMMNEVIKSNLRISCLSTPSKENLLHIVEEPLITDCSLLMWAHYAAMHKGICIEYDITDDILRLYNDESHILKWCKVRYRDKKAMCSDITLDNALLAKSDAWEYENESRLVYFSKKENEKDYVSLSGFPVRAVYLGYKVPRKLNAKLRELLESKGISLYEMHFRSEDITKLEDRQIL